MENHLVIMQWSVHGRNKGKLKNDLVITTFNVSFTSFDVILMFKSYMFNKVIIVLHNIAGYWPWVKQW